MPKKVKKKSTDPLQQTLRDHKAEWNSSVKEFIAHLIGAKQGVNGRGSPSLNIPPSNIKDPLPGEVGALLGALSSQFQSLIGGASSIITEQAAYSQGRRKKQEKKPLMKKPAVKPVEAPKPQQVPNQPEEKKDETAVNSFLSNVASESRKDDLQKYGSNRLSRMWQYMGAANPFSKDQMSKKRTGLLSSAADLYYEFLDLENAVLSMDIESIPTATSYYQTIHDGLMAFEHSLNDGEERPEEGKPEGVKPGKSEEPTNPTGEAAVQNQANVPDKTLDMTAVRERIQEIYQSLNIINGSSLGLTNECKHLIKQMGRLNRAFEANKGEVAYQKINEDFETLKRLALSRIEKEVNPAKKEELLKIVRAADLDTGEIIKLSHNYITRLLRRYWIGLRSSNKTSVHRLNVSTRVRVVKKYLQEIMNLLEAGKIINVKEINKKLAAVLVEETRIGHSLRLLNIMYRQDWLKKRRDKVPTNKSNMMDTILTNEMRRNLKENIL